MNNGFEMKDFISFKYVSWLSFLFLVIAYFAESSFEVLWLQMSPLLITLVVFVTLMLFLKENESRWFMCTITHGLFIGAFTLWMLKTYGIYHTFWLPLLITNIVYLLMNYYIFFNGTNVSTKHFSEYKYFRVSYLVLAVVFIILKSGFFHLGIMEKTSVFSYLAAIMLMLYGLSHRRFYVNGTYLQKGNGGLNIHLPLLSILSLWYLVYVISIKNF